jgi:hypothetical protein
VPSRGSECSLLFFIQKVENFIKFGAYTAILDALDDKDDFVIVGRSALIQISNDILEVSFKQQDGNMFCRKVPLVDCRHLLPREIEGDIVPEIIETIVI